MFTNFNLPVATVTFSDRLYLLLGKETAKKRPAESNLSTGGKKGKNGSLPKKQHSEAMNSDEEDDVQVIDESENPPNAPPAEERSKNMNWDMIQHMWEFEKRPKNLQDRAYVESLDLKHIITCYEAYILKEDIENKKKEKDAASNKDKLPEPQLFEEKEDDCLKNLHAARWCRMPLTDFPSWWPETPTVRKEVYLDLPLEFCGADNVVADKTLKLMHDKSNELQLKHFLAENVTVSSKPQKEVRTYDNDGSINTSVDFNWVAPTTLSQTKEAVLNFASVNFFLYPFDPTGLMLIRLLSKYKWLEYIRQEKTKVELLNTFFNMIMRKNKSAATNNRCIVSFSAMEEILRSILTKNHWMPDLFLRETRENQNQPKNQPQPFNQQGGSNLRQRSGNNGPAANSSRPDGKQADWKTASVNGAPLCWLYNNMKGKSCRNRKHKEGCQDDEKTYRVHLCNAWVSKKNDHCYGTHAKKDHKW